VERCKAHDAWRLRGREFRHEDHSAWIARQAEVIISVPLRGSRTHGLDSVDGRKVIIYESSNHHRTMIVEGEAQTSLFRGLRLLPQRAADLAHQVRATRHSHWVANGCRRFSPSS
jgi:hypothetical protein